MSATVVLARPHPGAVLVTLGGEVDLAVLERLTLLLGQAGGCPDVVVDAADVEFLDCCALRPLLVAARAASAVGGRLHLRDPSPAVTALVAWCGLEDRLPVQGAA